MRTPEPERLAPPRPSADDGTRAPARSHARSTTIGSHRTALGEDGERRLFVLDTNVLMHDPTALFRFQEHDVYLPMVVLEELDAAKKGTSEIARNVREVSRILDEMVRDADEAAIGRGIPLPGPASGAPAGCLLFQTRSFSDLLPQALPGSKPDNGILNVARALDREHPGRAVVIVSKDINLRIKARALGILAEDYRDDVVLDDVSLLYPGVYEMPPDDWAECMAAGAAQREEDGSFDVARRRRDRPGGFPTSACTRAATPARVCWCAGSRDGAAVLEPARDYRAGRRHRVGRPRAKHRAELRAEPADGLRHRLRDPDRHRRHRQDPSRACGRARPDPGREALPRNRDDPGHRARRRRHRIPARHRGGEDDAVDGGADGQPGGAHRPGDGAAPGGARPPATCSAAASRSAR